MNDFVLIILSAVSCFFLGNHFGDQATLRDCATKGIAKLQGGGTIKCEVVKDKGQS